jgi:alpha-1,2-mannosyltransferase
LMAGVLLLPKRPLLAGLLFGVVATLKPQAAVMVPLALIVGRHWRAMLAATLSGGAIGAASLAWRPELWSQWLKVLPTFSRIIDSDAWDMWIGVTPKAAAHQLGLQGTPLEPVLMAAAGALGVASVVMAFRREGAIQRYGALCVGYLLISPYALWYELALLQPVAVALLLERGWRPRAAGLVAYTLFGRILSTVAVAAMILSPSRRPQAGFSVPVRP